MNRLLDLVRETMTSILELASEEIELNVGFFDLGMDSAMATAFVRRLESALGRDLSTTLLFDYPTAQSLAAHLGTLVEPVAARATPTDDESAELLLGELRREIAAARAMRDTGSVG
jgi:acyl carrier protein